MTIVPTILSKRKSKIEHEFSMIGSDKVTIRVTPRIPDKIDITLFDGPVVRSKTIHYSDPSKLRELLRYHKTI